MGPPRDKQVALSTFSYVFSELVQYNMTKIRSSAELEANLEKLGKDLGKRVLDALFHRDRLTKRELTEVGILQFISTTAWKALWGKAADSLERSTDREDEYMIVDSAPLVNQFVSVPANLGALDCAALMAGVVAGILVCARRPIRYRRGSPLAPRRTAPTSPRSVPPILERKEGPCSSLGSGTRTPRNKKSRSSSRCGRSCRWRTARWHDF